MNFTKILVDLIKKELCCIIKLSSGCCAAVRP
uniref:Uncharacterized protein n=1 Tax=Arundo donax TaxID=35708 RepID=A0A0A9EKH8_ARUDO